MRKNKSAIKKRYFIGSALIILILALGSYALIIQPHNLDGTVEYYEMKISHVTVVDNINIDIDEKGDYDKNRFKSHEKALNLAEGDLKSISKEMDKENLNTLFGKNNNKEKLAKAIKVKSNSIEVKLKELSSLEKDAKSKSLAYKEKIEKEKEAKAKKKAIAKAKKEKELKEDKKKALVKAKEEQIIATSNTEGKVGKKEINQTGSTGNFASTRNTGTSAGNTSSSNTNTSNVSTGNTSSGNTNTQKGTPKANNTVKDTVKPKENKANPKPPQKAEPKPKDNGIAQGPEPKFGAVSRSNMNAVNQWKWEHGELYYVWSGNSWDTYIHPGSTVTNYDRWVSHLEKTYPKPGRNGKSTGEKVGAGTIWVFFGGKF